MAARTSSLCPPRPLRLARGSTHQLQLPRGGKLVSLGGTVLLAPAPQWLEGDSRRRLQSGETELLHDGGWFTITALSDAELVCVAPAPSAWTLWFALWRRPALRLITRS